VDKWQLVGILFILIGITVLALLSGFIITVIVTFLKLIAVFAGVLLIVAGAALLVGFQWMRRRKWGWSSGTSST